MFYDDFLIIEKQQMLPEKTELTEKLKKFFKKA